MKKQLSLLLVLFLGLSTITAPIVAAPSDLLKPIPTQFKKAFNWFKDAISTGTKTYFKDAKIQWNYAIKRIKGETISEEEKRIFDEAAKREEARGKIIAPIILITAALIFQRYIRNKIQIAGDPNKPFFGFTTPLELALNLHNDDPKKSFLLTRLLLNETISDKEIASIMRRGKSVYEPASTDGFAQWRINQALEYAGRNADLNKYIRRDSNGTQIAPYLLMSPENRKIVDSVFKKNQNAMYEFILSTQSKAKRGELPHLPTEMYGEIYKHVKPFKN